MGAKLLLLAWIGAFAGPVAATLTWRRLAPGPRRSPWALSALALFALIYVLGVWAFLVEPRTLVVRHVAVASPEWRGPPLRIGVVSDTHVGAPHVTPQRVQRTIERLNRETPDVVVFLGDYVGGHEPGAGRANADRSAILAGVAALGFSKARYGRAAILGNHDWWYDGLEVETALRRAGLRVLENDALRISRPDGAFWIAGLADFESRRARPDVDAALAAVPRGEPVIVLTHWPDAFANVPGRVAITLAGHTHCGQVNFPMVGRLAHASPGSARWPCGLYDEGGRKLFVTGGLGVSILPVRFRAPPEIVIVTLRAAP